MRPNTPLLSKWLYYYPICLTIVGIGIHFFGTLGLFQLEVPRFNHVVMLIIDFMVVIGLCKRTVWGYWLAIFLYIEQSIMQPYWGYEAFVEGQGLFQLLLTSPAVIAGLIILALNMKLFVRVK